MPAGWFEWQPAGDFEGVLVDSGPDASQGSGWGLMFLAVGPVSRDPCDRAKGTLDPAETATVDGLVTAMRGWPGFKATAPTPIVVDGYSGQLVELTSTRTSTECPEPVLWTTQLGWLLDAYPLVTADTTPHKVQFRIVDVDGTLLVIRTTDFPETSPNEADQGVAPDPTRHGRPGRAPRDPRLDQGDQRTTAAVAAPPSHSALRRPSHEPKEALEVHNPSPMSTRQYLAASVEEDRRRGEERRHAHHRALLTTRAERPSLVARLVAASLRVVRGDLHSLTDYPCRLPDGKIGRTAVVRSGGDWVLVCRVA